MREVPDAFDQDPPRGRSVLMPTDWEAFLKSRTEFAKQWDRYTGLR